MRATVTIDLDALRRNVRRLRALAQPSRYLAVIKANAYGHGSAAVARALANDVFGFCVYRADEAIALRDAGIASPILVLGPLTGDELARAHAADAAVTLWSDGAFRRDCRRLAGRSGAPVRAHAKVDTGVTRLGIDATMAASRIASYLDDSALALDGAYTHLADAEEPASPFTHAQLDRFASALAPISERLRTRRVMRHAAASAAAMLFPAARLDAVRAGIATYGIWPSFETQAAMRGTIALEPALAWRTDLVVVRDVEAGRSVGYGCTFTTTRPSRIGVLPIGYAEGVPRALSGAGTVLVRGRRVPLVGRVCMNMCFVDVTDVPDATTGDLVTLIGADGDECIDANELAAAAGTIGYEVVTRLPDALPRRYVASDEPENAMASARSSVPS